MQLKKEIENAITEFCVEVVQNPMIYFSEADLQQLLVDRLRLVKRLGKLYPTAVLRGKGAKTKYRTSLVHREYGAKQGKRIDVAVFSKTDVARINSPNLTIGKKYLTPEFGFELGTEKSTETLKHYRGDLEKLKECKTGYLIHVFTDNTTSRKGTKTNAKTESKIQLKFKSVFEKNGAKENVVVIAILLRPYKKQSKTRGKLEIFDGTAWKPVNISKKVEIRKAIRKQFNE